MGFDWEEGDLDIWLDPNLSDEDWQAAVDDAAGTLKRPWKRGEPDGSGGLRASTRIACSPPLDVMREVMGCTKEDFEKAFDNSLISFYGNVAHTELDHAHQTQREASQGLSPCHQTCSQTP